MRSRLRFVLCFALAAPLACNAILGVTDVKLRDGDRAGGHDGDNGDNDDVYIPDDDAATSRDPNRVLLALGTEHTCARMPDGTAKCWGSDAVGQLGTGIPFDGGTRNDALEPQVVRGVDTVEAIGSGLSHTCIVHTAGNVECWGANLFGELGDGTTDKSSSPVKVLDVDNASDVSGGTSHTCALLKDKTAACWGANYSGQLGDGTTGSMRPHAAPVKDLTNAIAITTGRDHSCAVTQNHTAVCWGGNTDGQLGNGGTDDSPAPATVKSLEGVAQIAAAALFTCARQTTGKVYCWGNNQFGQLGTGSASTDPNPTPVPVAAVADAVFVWTGENHACAVKKDKSIVCWGSAVDGQLGNGPDGAAISAPVTVIGAQKAAAVWTNGNRSCSLSDDKSAFCWGADSKGQLGDGTRNRAFTAVQVKSFP